MHCEAAAAAVASAAAGGRGAAATALALAFAALPCTARMKSLMAEGSSDLRERPQPGVGERGKRGEVRREGEEREMKGGGTKTISGAVTLSMGA